MALPTSPSESKQVEEVTAVRPGSSGAPMAPITSLLTVHELVTNTSDKIPELYEVSYDQSKLLREVLIDEGYADQIKDARTKGDAYEDYHKVKAKVLSKAKAHTETSTVFVGYSAKQKRFLAEMITNDIIGYGPIQPFWDSDMVNEIQIDGPHHTFAEYRGKRVKVTNCRFKDASHLLEVCQAIVAAVNRSFDSKNPLVDAKLPDLSRVNMTHTDIASEGPYVSIRKFRKDTWTMEKYMDAGAIDPEMALDLSQWVEKGCSSIIIGGTGSGKTSVLNAMSGQIQEGTRLIVMEDSRELKLPIHTLYEESRKSNAQGEGEITLSDLVINSLRQTPDRVIVGEARDGHAMMAVMKAMSTGHSGSISTVHANNAEDGVERFVTEIQTAMPAVNRETILRTICGAVDIFITVSKFAEDGSRRITGIYEVPNRLEEDGSFKPIPLWEWVTDTVMPRDENGNRKVVGHWEKRNGLSERLRTLYRIYDEDRPTIEQMRARSQGNWEGQ